MTRKRFVKLMMSYGYGRNLANKIASDVVCYKEEIGEFQPFDCGGLSCVDMETLSKNLSELSLLCVKSLEHLASALDFASSFLLGGDNYE